MTKRKAEKVLRIGIASRAEMRARTLAVARGELKPAPSDPKVWFSSLESLARALAERAPFLFAAINRLRPER